MEFRLKQVINSLNLATQAMWCGSTASIVFLPWSGDSVTVAVLGDSPVLVKRADGSVWVAPEHNVRTNQAEADAVIKRGGMVSGGYAYATYSGNGLQMARALGDAELNRILSQTPDVSTHPLGIGSWVLVATDGALDPSHANEAAGIAALTKMLNKGDDAQAVVDRALKIRTGDNVTAMVVRVQPKA